MDALRIHWLQHVPFEGLGSIESWVRKKGHRLTGTRLWNAESLPQVADLDWLIVMGGPMSVADEALFPWLVPEKRFIQDCLAAGKRVLGICLGAQLVAEVLGAKVAPNPGPEIGWFPVRFDAVACAAEGWQMLPETLTVFHWHGDRFEIPEGATLLGQSAACDHQAFCRGRQVLGLQFHLETTEEGAAALIEHCGEELAEGAFIQRPEQMLNDPGRFAGINRVMEKVLEKMAVGG